MMLYPNILICRFDQGVYGLGFIEYILTEVQL